MNIFYETLLFKDNNREQSTNNKCIPRSCSPTQIYKENMHSTTESLSPPNSCVLLLSREDCLPKTCTAVEYFLSFWTLCKFIHMFSFVSNFFDSKLCLRFTHDVVYGNISFTFIIIEYSFEWSHDPALNHSSNGRDLSLFPVLDYYKYNGANYHDDFWQKYLLWFLCV